MNVCRVLKCRLSTNFYKVLGVQASAKEEQIKQAYYRLAKLYHPDSGSQKNQEKFKQILEAYNCLVDFQRRADHDSKINPFKTNEHGSQNHFSSKKKVQTEQRDFADLRYRGDQFHFKKSKPSIRNVGSLRKLQNLIIVSLLCLAMIRAAVMMLARRFSSEQVQFQQ